MASIGLDCSKAGASAERTGRWTEEEHELFLQGLQLHEKEWKKIAEMIPTRTVVQIRTHAQKYFQKIAKDCEEQGKDVPKDLTSTASNPRFASENARRTQSASRRRRSGLLPASQRQGRLGSTINSSGFSKSYRSATSLRSDTPLPHNFFSGAQAHRYSVCSNSSATSSSSVDSDETQTLCESSLGNKAEDIAASRKKADPICQEKDHNRKPKVRKGVSSATRKKNLNRSSIRKHRQKEEKPDNAMVPVSHRRQGSNSWSIEHVSPWIKDPFASINQRVSGSVSPISPIYDDEYPRKSDSLCPEITRMQRPYCSSVDFPLPGSDSELRRFCSENTPIENPDWGNDFDSDQVDFDLLSQISTEACGHKDPDLDDEISMKDVVLEDDQDIISRFRSQSERDIERQIDPRVGSNALHSDQRSIEANQKLFRISRIEDCCDLEQQPALSDDGPLAVFVNAPQTL